jgi:hypothetical protein
MKSIALYFETASGKYLKNLIIGIGAGVVLVGALFKIEHLPGASIMLTIGMCTEAFIFVLLGLLPPHKDYYWEKYYPGLDENPHVEAARKGISHKPTSSLPGQSATASLDKMMEEAQINPANLKRLSDNFQKFGQSVDQMKDLTEVTSVTNEFTTTTRQATAAIGTMTTSFSGASETMNAFNNAAADTASFHQQVQVLSKNLGSLNQIYEVELQDANNHLKAMNKFYSNLVTASESMASSAEDAQKAKEQIAKLATNLGTLNQIYGNMLTAMQGR